MALNGLDCLFSEECQAKFELFSSAVIRRWAAAEVGFSFAPLFFITFSEVLFFDNLYQVSMENIKVIYTAYYNRRWWWLLFR